MTHPNPGRLSALTNTLIVAGGYALSRVLGLLRDVIVFAQFGTSPQLDAYRAAFALLDLIYLIVAGGALSSAFIPVFAGLLEKQQVADAWRLAGVLLRIAALALVAACALLALLAGPLVALTVGSGFDAGLRAQTVELLRLMLLQPLLLGLGALGKATLESYERFSIPALGANLYNIGIIVGALLAPWLGIYGLVLGVNLGALLFVLIQLPALWRLWTTADRRPTTDDRRPMTDNRRPTGTAAPLREIGRLLGPRVIGQSVWQINMVAIASFASLLGTGAVAANSAAFQLMLLPHGLVALSLGTVIFPALARRFAAGDLAGVQAQAVQALRWVLFVGGLAGALLLGLAGPLVRLLYQRGQFGAGSVFLTTAALTGYALGLAAFAGAEIAVRSFYALRDTRTPVVIGAVTVALNIGLGWLVVQLVSGFSTGIALLALAFSAASVIELLLLLVWLGRRLGGLAGLWRALLAVIFASALSGGLMLALQLLGQRWLGPLDGYRWPQDFLPLALLTGAAGLAGTLIYLGVAEWLRLGEVRQLLDRVRRRDSPASGT